MRRVLVPAHITPACTGESASDEIDPVAAGDARAGFPLPPMASVAAVPGAAARSGLIVRQCSPLSGDMGTCCAPMYNACGVCGEKTRGGAPPKRSVLVG